jgi:hypothetical protein
MHTRRFERLALRTFFLAACVAFSGACVAIAHAHSPATNSVPSAPPPFLDTIPSWPLPVFDPLGPYTLPPSTEIPISPETPGTLSGFARFVDRF